jgi:HEAT repeat protein
MNRVTKQVLLVLLPILALGCGKKEVKGYTVEGLTESLQDPDPGVRYTAAFTLGTYGSKAAKAVPALTDTLKDSDKNVRVGAVYALAEIGPEARSAIPAIQEALRDEEPLVREGAAYALKRLQSKPGKR